MKLRRYIVTGICGIVIGLIAMILLASQVILVNSYHLLEQQEAKAHVQRVIDIFKNDIDAFKISDINWTLPPNPRPTASTSERGNNVDIRLIEKFSFDTGSTATLLDRQNNVIFRNMDTGKNIPVDQIPSSLIEALQADTRFSSVPNFQRTIKGLITLPEGPLMMISIPLPAGSGRVIWGRFLDEAEVQQLSERTQLEVRVMPYAQNNVPADFQRAKVNLGGEDSLYIEPKNDQTLAGYTLLYDVFGEPSVVVKVQIPRTIHQIGQNGLTNFTLILIICVIGVAIVAYFLIEQEILAPLNTLKIYLNEYPITNTTKHSIDEFNTLATGIHELHASRTDMLTKLQYANDKLESRVAERTSELFIINTSLQQQIDANKQVQTSLIMARDKAIEALNWRSRLIANVSHDARTPLTIIGLNTEMLQQRRHGDLNAKQNEVLDRILIATRQLFNFMTNILGESQLANGKVSLVKVVFEPKLLIEDLVSMLKPLADRKDIQLRSEVDLAYVPKIMGDPERLRQVIINLCENAIKFTQVGEVVVKSFLKDQNHWIVQVKDTGCGIPKEAQSHIFEAYWQAENTMATNTNRGVGLGLSIVKQFVELMNGTIVLESQPGLGTTFTITLPIEREPSQVHIELSEKLATTVQTSNSSSFETTQQHECPNDC